MSTRTTSRNASAKRTLATGLAVLLGAAAAACSIDVGSGSLLTRSGGNETPVEGDLPPGTTPGTTPDGGGSTATDASTLAADSAAAAQATARVLFDKLYPDLDKACGTCHATGVANSPKFLEKPDAYASITKYAGIIVKDYLTSKLLTISASVHSGGAGVEGELRVATTAWLKSEAAAVAAAPPATSDAVAIVAGPNTLDLSKAGAGVTGAKMTFDAAIAGSIITFSKLAIVAPATTGLQVTAPKFVIVDGAGKETEDPVDSLSNFDRGVAQGQTLALPTVVLSIWAPTHKLRVIFKAIKPTNIAADAGAPTGGCKSVATFTSSAAPTLTNQCRGCHGGGNAGATGAMDLRMLGTNNAAACAQALTKVNLTNKPQSAIITRPRAGSGHPAVNGFNQANHDQAMLGWINNE